MLHVQVQILPGSCVADKLIVWSFTCISVFGLCMIRLCYIVILLLVSLNAHFHVVFQVEHNVGFYGFKCSKHLTKGSRFHSPHKVVLFWQKSKAPVYLLKGSRDVIIYRGLMGTGLVGLGYVAYTIYMMATGKMKKQEKS